MQEEKDQTGNSMSSEELSTLVLSELGFNEYETRAYLTILESGTVVAREVSDKSSIPYAKVYQVLESLIQKQLIIGDESRPKKFRCRDPKDALIDRLNYLENDWMNKHNRRKKLVEKSMGEFSDMFNTTKVHIEEEQGVWTITGLSNIQSRINKLISETNEIIRVSAGQIDMVMDLLKKSHLTKDSKYQLIIKTKENKQFFKKYTTNIVKTEELGSAVIFIFDDFAQLSIIVKNKGRYGKGEYIGVHTQIRELVASYIMEF